MPAFYSEGCVLLSTYLDKKNIEQKGFAEKAKMGAAFLNHILKGRKRPSLDTAARIELETDGKVPARAWASEHKPRRRRKAS